MAIHHHIEPQEEKLNREQTLEEIFARKPNALTGEQLLEKWDLKRKEYDEQGLLDGGLMPILDEIIQMGKVVKTDHLPNNE